MAISKNTIEGYAQGNIEGYAQGDVDDDTARVAEIALGWRDPEPGMSREQALACVEGWEADRQAQLNADDPYADDYGEGDRYPRCDSGRERFGAG